MSTLMHKVKRVFKDNCGENGKLSELAIGHISIDGAEIRKIGKRMRAVSQLDSLLDEIIPRYNEIMDYLGSCSQEEARELGDELAVFFDALHDFTYSRGKFRIEDQRIEYLKEIKKAYERKAKAKTGKNEGQPQDNKPSSRLDNLIGKGSNDPGAEKTPAVTADNHKFSAIKKEKVKPAAALLPSGRHDAYTHTGFDLTRYACHKGIIDEEDNFYLLNLALIRRGLIVVEGPSSTGKTYMVDRCLELYPESMQVKFATGSKKSYFYNPRLGTGEVRLLYLVEIQMALRENKEVEEMVKTIGEGKDFARPVINPSTKETFEIMIPKDAAIVGTHAYENDFVVSDEIKNRALELVTKFGNEHNIKITEREAEKQYTLERDKFISDEEIRSLKRHIEKCFYMTEPVIMNPFADIINEIYPHTNKYNRLQKMYYEMIKGSAIFNHHNRVSQSSPDILFVNLEDFYNVFRAYHQQCMHDLLDIPMTSESVIKTFSNQCMKEKNRITEEDIRSELASDKSLNATVIRKTLDLLSEKLYLKRAGSNGNPSYEKLKDIEDFEFVPDLAGWFRIGERVMQQNFPGIADRWRDNHLHENVRAVLDYRANELVEF